MLYTVNDLAKYFRRTRRTINRWRRAGWLPPPDRVVNLTPFWEERSVNRIGKPDDHKAPQLVTGGER